MNIIRRIYFKQLLKNFNVKGKSKTFNGDMALREDIDGLGGMGLIALHPL